MMSSSWLRDGSQDMAKTQRATRVHTGGWWAAAGWVECRPCWKATGEERRPQPSQCIRPLSLSAASAARGDSLLLHARTQASGASPSSCTSTAARRRCSSCPTSAATRRARRRRRASCRSWCTRRRLVGPPTETAQARGAAPPRAWHGSSGLPAQQPTPPRPTLAALPPQRSSSQQTFLGGPQEAGLCSPAPEPAPFLSPRQAAPAPLVERIGSKGQAAVVPNALRRSARCTPCGVTWSTTGVAAEPGGEEP